MIIIQSSCKWWCLQACRSHHVLPRPLSEWMYAWAVTVTQILFIVRVFFSPIWKCHSWHKGDVCLAPHLTLHVPFVCQNVLWCFDLFSTLLLLTWARMHALTHTCTTTHTHTQCPVGPLSGSSSLHFHCRAWKTGTRTPVGHICLSPCCFSPEFFWGF